jgi:hypothetical protein
MLQWGLRATWGNTGESPGLCGSCKQYPNPVKPERRRRSICPLHFLPRTGKET